MTFSAIYAKIGFVCSHYTQYIKEDKIMNSKDNRSSFSGKIGFVLSAAGASVCIRVLAGESPDTEQLEWDSLPYTLLQDYGELNRRKENGLGELLEQENVQYQIETYEIASLGNEIRYKGSFWYIGGVERHLEKGILVNSYVLRKEAGLKVLPYFNQRLTGISIDGQIAAAKRDRVQVDMEIDNGGKEGEHY